MAEKNNYSSKHIVQNKELQTMLCDNLSFAAAEAYKLLRTNLMFSLPDKPCRILGVTSSVRGEGKSTTSVNLAYTFAQAGKRTLLIDADMRLPSVATKLNIPRAPGLSNLLAGMSKENAVFRRSDFFSNWMILSAGDIPPNPSELLGSERMRALLEHYSEYCDFIIVDLPPINIVTDALVISPWLDGLIVVVRQNYTDRRALSACMYQVRQLGSKFLGFVTTDAAVGKTGYKYYGKYGHRYGYAYGYGYGYGNNQNSQNAKKQSDNAFFAATVEEPSGSSAKAGRDD